MAILFLLHRKIDIPSTKSALKLKLLVFVSAEETPEDALAISH